MRALRRVAAAALAACIVAKQLGVATQKEGLVDGPVYRSILESLLSVRLLEPDEYAAWNGGSIVYHDDWGDHSTNEPIMDGTANLVWLLSALEAAAPASGQAPGTAEHGVVTTDHRIHNGM